MTRYGRVIKKPQALGYNNCTTAISHRRQRPLANDSISTNNLSHAPRRAKQLVDLTNAVPPKWWVEEYRKGIKLSRELRIYPTQDRVILFYDYGTKVKRMSLYYMEIMPAFCISLNALICFMS